MDEKFKNREEGGKALANALASYKDRRDTIVLALPRGGVPVAFEVAKALNLPIDVFVVRKLGVPGRSELAFGAVASGGFTVFNEDIVRALALSNSTIEDVIKTESAELERRLRTYRSDRPPPELAGRTVIIVDDGLATGATMRAAVEAVRRQGPSEIVVAAPDASRATCKELENDGVDHCICVRTPEPFYGVGIWYTEFTQTTDEEVCRLLEKPYA